MFYYPRLATENWRPDWDSFPWAGESAAAERWRRGQTGEPIVDAAMREMYVTGRMHNRARMIVASYLTKHLLTDWRIGLAWFEDCLIDHDPAANAMGWQWVAGCGPDAAPYFRIFNPASQAEKFDPEGRYRRAWLAEGNRHAPQTAQDFFAAVPRSWGGLCRGGPLGAADRSGRGAGPGAGRLCGAAEDGPDRHRRCHDCILIWPYSFAIPVHCHG
ncbi:FAD-binding domain-containing protein [Rhodobacter capsulatus]|uniref:FAD-binding domain-containing protein n=1 Tax=Rhodobacter capsulatus TaxID=1061 RepID=UPI004026A549